jgi:hypothetical protein
MTESELGSQPAERIAGGIIGIMFSTFAPPLFDNWLVMILISQEFFGLRPSRRTIEDVFVEIYGVST